VKGSIPAKFYIAVIFGLVLLSCGKKEKKTVEVRGGNRQMIVRVDGYIVKTEALSENVELPGTIIANEATEIHPEIPGRLTHLNAREGLYVGRGAVIARLYDGDLQAQLNKLQVQLKIAEQKQKRLEELQKIGGISKQDYDLSVLEVSNIRSDIAIVHADLSKTVVRAPFAGKLGLKNISPGAYVTPATIITTIQQTSQLKLDFTVPEKYTDKIKTGQIVNFTYAGSKKKYAARVLATESSVSETTRSLVVRSLVINKDDELMPGTFAKVILNFEPDPDAMMIPTQAVLPQARGKKVILFNNGVAKFTDVVTGVRDSSRVQVTEGLKPGDTVVVTGLLTVRPDAKIQINKIVNSEQ
jgi:membrane fusion protein, multidrug efflux system